ncbi:hypothetical protein AXF42_Ash019554 [Apostasia shenzhenica]|uniref:Uncharacterized protein n=1 Tax=Apostasia shenzhenica TaxID=1088818 RepID=A0A2I0AV33_9ASPA|nr:hypothetical protein AXF42_Ash019554 [Apostasia shenzhenica]
MLRHRGRRAEKLSKFVGRGQLGATRRSQTAAGLERRNIGRESRTRLGSDVVERRLRRLRPRVAKCAAGNKQGPDPI